MSSRRRFGEVKLWDLSLVQALLSVAPVPTNRPLSNFIAAVGGCVRQGLRRSVSRAAAPPPPRYRCDPAATEYARTRRESREKASRARCAHHRANRIGRSAGTSPWHAAMSRRSPPPTARRVAVGCQCERKDEETDAPSPDHCVRRLTVLSHCVSHVLMATSHMHTLALRTAVGYTPAAAAARAALRRWRRGAGERARRRTPLRARTAGRGTAAQCWRGPRSPAEQLQHGSHSWEITRLSSRVPLIIGAGDLFLRVPCQRPEGALAGRSRSSRPRAGAGAPALEQEPKGLQTNRVSKIKRDDTDQQGNRAHLRRERCVVASVHKQLRRMCTAYPPAPRCSVVSLAGW
jgi:hypothetical protein